MTRRHLALGTGVLVSALLSFLAAAPLSAGDEPPKEGGGKTAARPTAQTGFEALRKAAAEKDEPTLLRCLPAALVAKWDEQAKDDAKPWRAALAERIAAGTVVAVRENGDQAIARWKTTAPAADWELRMRLDGGHWVASAPWAYCVAGGDLATANGKGPAKVKLEARKADDKYGDSAYSFQHATGDPKQCKNRMDVWYCAGGHLHGGGGNMLSRLDEKTLAKVDGIPWGGDWMDQVEPKSGTVYVVRCAKDGRKDFDAVLQVTAVSPGSVTFEWRLAAAGTPPPASIHKPQPLVSNDGDDGCDGNCGP